MKLTVKCWCQCPKIPNFIFLLVFGIAVRILFCFVSILLLIIDIKTSVWRGVKCFFENGFKKKTYSVLN